MTGRHSETTRQALIGVPCWSLEEWIEGLERRTIPAAHPAKTARSLGGGSTHVWRYWAKPRDRRSSACAPHVDAGGSLPHGRPNVVGQRVQHQVSVKSSAGRPAPTSAPTVA
jgi:hypothetical protein